MTNEELSSLNAELSQLLGIPRRELAQGSTASLDDELVICGLLGGKESGKTTLINALAVATVSVSARKPGEGTSQPVAYLHGDAVAAFRRRAQRSNVVQEFVHSVESLRNAVLIDFPDFDSEFESHARWVDELSPILDRVVWLMTPRKIVDAQWLARARQTLKNHDNQFFALNKVDELFADADPFAATASTTRVEGQEFADVQRAWFRCMLRASGWLVPEERVFAIASAYPTSDALVRRVADLWEDSEWKRYSTDRQHVVQAANHFASDFSRLRECVLSIASERHAVTIKRANIATECQHNIHRLWNEYELPATVSHLAAVCEPSYVELAARQSLGEDLVDAVAHRLGQSLRSDRELADELLERRVEHWPVLRLVHWPFGWLSRILGRGMSASDHSRRRDVDPFGVPGRSIEDRIETLKSRLLGDLGVLADQMNLEGAMPEAKSLTGGFRDVVRDSASDLERDLLDRVWSMKRRPSVIGRTLLWFVILWFPLLQPICEGLLIVQRGGGTMTILDGVLHLVSALSAPRLLASLAVVMGVCVAVLAGLYARGLRRLRKLRESATGEASISQLVGNVLAEHVVAPLWSPIRVRHQRLSTIMSRIVDDSQLSIAADESVSSQNRPKQVA